MATRGGERRMVFDVRGKRRHVVRAVYAVLSLLMMASLFFVVGPFNVGELVGRGGGGSSAAKLYEEQAARIEGRLLRSPRDAALLLALTRARINAGNAQVKRDPETGAEEVTPEARLEYEAALSAWRRYRKQAGAGANPLAAQLVANTFWALAQSSLTYPEAEQRLRSAAAAQRIFAAARPSLNSLSTLARYTYLSFDYSEGARIGREAAARALSRVEKNQLKLFLNEARKLAHNFQKGARAAAKAEKGRGKEVLEHPLGGLGGGSPLGP
jgi:hypothetical protein